MDDFDKQDQVETDVADVSDPLTHEKKSDKLEDSMITPAKTHLERTRRKAALNAEKAIKNTVFVTLQKDKKFKHGWDYHADLYDSSLPTPLYIDNESSSSSIHPTSCDSSDTSNSEPYIT